MSKEETDDIDFAITETFKMFDKNHRNYIMASELGSALRKLGFKLTATELKDLAAVMDKDKNGKIDFTEFRNYVIEQMAANSKYDKDQQMRMVFQIFDTDKNGVIDKQELKVAMRRLGEKITDSEAASTLHEADTNDDGVMDFEEFKVLWNAIMP